MANYSTLKASVNAYIKANGVRAITGPVLNGILTQMINTLGDGARYGGIATPSGNPGAHDNVVFFAATTAGTYTNYGGFTLDGTNLHFFMYDGDWHDEDTGIPVTTERLLRDLGYNAQQSAITLTAGETGKYVKAATRAATANANFNISAPVEIDACTEVLIKTGYNPSDENHAPLDISVISIVEEMERTRTVQAKDDQNRPLYYVVVIDPETGSETVTEDTTTQNTGYPVYTQETYTETRYLPNNEDRFVAIPDSGYYVANIPQSCKIAISYKPGVSDLDIILVKHGAFANLTSQMFTVFQQRVVAEAVAYIFSVLDAMEASAGNIGDVQAGIVDATEFRVNGYPCVLSAAGAPAEALRPAGIPADLPWDGVPAFVGQEYLDTTNKKFYKAFGVSSVSDWVLQN